MSNHEVRIESCGYTDEGKVRGHNEDYFLIADPSRDKYRSTNGEMDFAGDGVESLFIVSDGMGGAAAGEVASQLSAIAIYKKLKEAVGGAVRLSGDDLVRILEESIKYANSVVYQRTFARPEWRGMGTTVTVALVYDRTLYMGQIGDSRAYLIRGSEITQVTKDQSLVGQMVDKGEISEEAARTHPRRNILLQALGVSPYIDVALTDYKLCRGDYLVLCSDGLHALVPREEIKSIVEQTEDLHEACRQLVDTANRRGGPDNITVILAKFSGEGLPSRTAQDKVTYPKSKR